jgi:hypothetical protein
MHVYLHHIQYKLRHLITQANRFWCELPLLHVWDEIVILRNFVYMFQFYLDIVIWIEQINCYLTKYVYMNYISMKCTIGVQEKFKDTKGVSRRRQSQNDRTIPWPKDQEHRRRQSQNDRTMTKRTRTQKTSITERSDHDQKNKNTEDVNHRTIRQYHDQKNKNTEDVNHRTIRQYHDQKNKNTEDVNHRTIGPWPKEQEHRRRQSQNDRTMTKRTRTTEDVNHRTIGPWPKEQEPQKTSITERSDHDQKNKSRQAQEQTDNILYKTQTIKQHESHQKWRVDLIRNSSTTSVTVMILILKIQSYIEVRFGYAYVMSIQHCYPMKCLT